MPLTWRNRRLIYLCDAFTIDIIVDNGHQPRIMLLTTTTPSKKVIMVDEKSFLRKIYENPFLAYLFV
jgi:hypothetical protein